MCLILFAYRVHPTYKLIVAANRDEFYQRPTAGADYWEDYPEILAGRDLEKMGTWMGVTKRGRFAALTNYRNPKEVTEGKRTRGELVANALSYKGSIEDYMQELNQNNHEYPGYNLIAGDANELYYYSNIGQELKKLEPGIYGVSNHLLNTEWPKVQAGREGMKQILKEEPDSMEQGLFNLLQNAEQVPDALLPKTGVTLEWERMLSPLFIKSNDYGTRSSTVVFMSDKETEYMERVFANGRISDRKFTIVIE